MLDAYDYRLDKPKDMQMYRMLMRKFKEKGWYHLIKKGKKNAK